ncbi:unnamed protein product [Kluyveromyces dobzhanskii CBS 2104]|uniref:ubiquitinyl hydrolase 1 n=1 Tax=Kluyveromyces dobzhanskii CBS 2104 TaxID=1427455 RepID=A0A0A8L639_9SACH|nr:unnamed protein product [Kluyveromyces dobzhanskii CBS 2104]
MTDSVKPLVDRIVSQPLEFKKAVQEDSYNVGGEDTSYIMISSGVQKQQQNAEEKDDEQQQKREQRASKGSSKGVSKPASFAEALKMYTTKKSNVAGAESRADAGQSVVGSSVDNGTTASGKVSIGLSDELLLSDDEYHGSSTEDEEHPIVSLLENKVTSDSKSMSGLGSSSSSIGTTPAGSSSDDEDEEEVFHEASEFVQPAAGLSVAAEQLDAAQDAEDSEDASFHGSGLSSSEDEEQDEDEDEEDDEIQNVSAEEKDNLKLEAEEYAVKRVAPSLVAKKVDGQREQDSEEESENDEDELKHKSPLAPSPTPPLTLQDKSSFYQFNESVNDHGSNKPQRIVKNWGSKLTQLKPRGLLNHGVTCYTNAAVQAMVHIPAIQHYLFEILRGKFKDTVKPNSVSTLLAETTMRMWSPDGSKNTYINPKELINALEDINCMMSAWNQEDSHEYFMSLMSRLQEDSVPKGHKMTESTIYDVFGGLLQQSVKCSNCGEISTTEQPIYDLSLHLKGKKNTDQENSQDNSYDQQQSSKRRFSIEKSIRDFFNPELIKRVDNKEGYTCEKCKKVTNALKSNKIVRAPETLVVHLKKFRFNGTSSSKMKQAVSYPMFLDLTEYCHESISSLPVRYQLISVVVHEGRSLSSGHYISHCKQPDGSWATYDDEYINKITEKQLLIEPNAYYLVYTRLTPKSIPLSSTDSNKAADLGIPQLQRPPSSHSSSSINSKRKNKKKNKKRRISP